MNKTKTVTLEMQETYAFPRLAKEQKQLRMLRAEALQQAYLEKRHRQEAMNALETDAYRLRDWLRDASYGQYMDPELQGSLGEALTKALQMIEAEDALSSSSYTTEAYKRESIRLASLIEPVKKRRENHLGLPEATQQLRLSLDAFFTLAKRAKSSVKNDISDGNLDKAIQLANEVRAWLEMKLREQKEQTLWQEPVLWVEMVNKRRAEVEAERIRLQGGGEHVTPDMLEQFLKQQQEGEDPMATNKKAGNESESVKKAAEEPLLAEHDEL